MMLLADLLFVSLCILGFTIRFKELNPFSTSTGRERPMKALLFSPWVSVSFSFYKYLWNTYCIFSTVGDMHAEGKTTREQSEVSWDKMWGRWWGHTFWVNSGKRGPCGSSHSEKWGSYPPESQGFACKGAKDLEEAPGVILQFLPAEKLQELVCCRLLIL